MRSIQKILERLPPGEKHTQATTGQSTFNNDTFNETVLDLERFVREECLSHTNNIEAGSDLVSGQQRGDVDVKQRQAFRFTRKGAGKTLRNDRKAKALEKIGDILSKLASLPPAVLSQMELPLKSVDVCLG